jgi:hypothetical protein
MKKTNFIELNTCEPNEKITSFTHLKEIKMTNLIKLYTKFKFGVKIMHTCKQILIGVKICLHV